jgi:hypothetical protein
MKIYSSVLTGEDIRGAVPHGTGLEEMTSQPKPRLAARAWNVLLNHPGRTRPFATGTHGAGGVGAATYDDYGHFLAPLFERDPDMRVRGQISYDGSADFHARTEGRFSPSAGYQYQGERSVIGQHLGTKYGMEPVEADRTLSRARRTRELVTVDVSGGRLEVEYTGRGSRGSYEVREDFSTRAAGRTRNMR